MRMYTCGVPREYCNGCTVTPSSGIRLTVLKAHNSAPEAFKCHARYLIKILGYEQIGSREFRPPDGGPILVLTKKCRFGGILRKGKGSGEGGNRVMPRKGMGGFIASY